MGDKLIDLKPERMTVDEHIELLKIIVKFTEENIETLKADNSELMIKINSNQFSKSDLKKLASFPRMINYLEDKRDKLDTLKNDIQSNPNNWVINVFNKKIIYKPLDISKYCKELYACAKRVLVMSATILDKDMYCKQIGMNPDEVAFISIDSDFPIENRPIYKSYLGKLNKNVIDLPSTHRVIANKLCDIMKNYNTRGIIHMPTNKLINDVLPYMEPEQRRRLYVVMNMTSQERTKVLTEFKNNKLGVLISPSLYVGIDLKDDLSRFQIVTKIPYPSLGDRWIAKKAENNKWYSWTTLLKVVQGCGRSVRHMDDYSNTYILDANFENILKYSNYLLPKSFKDAIEYGKTHTPVIRG
jgi:Rad3-related DNA helicase